MELTSFTDYSLRVLIYLAKMETEKSSIDELADFYEISRHHVAKIVKRLSDLGYLETTRGKQGGVSLAEKPEHINLAKVIQQTEPHFDLVPCFSKEGKTKCVIDGHCGLKKVLFSARGKFFAHLREFTLSDLI